MSPRYVFSRHAKNRMRHNEPKIAEAEAIAVVEKPDKTTPSEEGRQTPGSNARAIGCALPTSPSEAR